jgi:AcrR family transcriptional regulator
MDSSLAVEADEGATVATGRSVRTYYYEQLLASSTRIPMPARSPRRERIVARKSPRQARSERTVATILEAAARVLARDSLDGFNTNRVAEVAGLSIGSLYQYFPNKSALIAALIRRAHDELADALELAVLGSEGGTLESSLASLVRVAIDQQYGRPLLAAALDHEELRLPVQPLVAEAGQRMLACIVTVLQRHDPGSSAAGLQRVARDCLVITKALVEADSNVQRQPPPDLERRILKAVMGYLRDEPSR